jgi:hypothetical protein
MTTPFAAAHLCRAALRTRDAVCVTVPALLSPQYRHGHSGAPTVLASRGWWVSAARGECNQPLADGPHRLS